MPKYRLSGDVSKYVEYFKNSRQREKNKLEHRLSLVPNWQTRLAKLKDNTPERLVTERLAKLQELMKENGLIVVAARFNPAPVSACIHYKKGEVKMKNLTSELSISSNGTVSIDVYRVPAKDKDAYYYRHKAADKIMRIYIGEVTRITNNVLRTLITRETA